MRLFSEDWKLDENKINIKNFTFFDRRNAKKFFQRSPLFSKCKKVFLGIVDFKVRSKIDLKCLHNMLELILIFCKIISITPGRFELYT